MVTRYIAVKSEQAHQIISVLDQVGIKYTYYGHDDTWDVIAMHQFTTGSWDSTPCTYERALELVGVIA